MSIRFFSQFSSFYTVLVELIGLGSLQSDLKSIASTWKHVSKLALDYHSVYHTLQLQQNPIESNDESLSWLNICIESLCKLIAENVQKSLDAVMHVCKFQFKLDFQPTSGWLEFWTGIILKPLLIFNKYFSSLCSSFQSSKESQ